MTAKRRVSGVKPGLCSGCGRVHLLHGKVPSPIALTEKGWRATDGWRERAILWGKGK